MQEINVNKEYFKGNAKEITGKVVEDDLTRMEGTSDKIVGTYKEVLKDSKQTLSGHTVYTHKTNQIKYKN